ncbi:retrotransposon protein, putative, ty1-copia subclass [Tanacetum coccineum]
MVRSETVKLLILYWTTYIEYDVQTIYLRHKMGLNMLLDIVIPDYNALCLIKAKSCTCWQLSHAGFLLSLPFLMVAAAQNTNNTTIRSILLGEKLTGSNFTNWYRNLRIVLRYEKKLKFVEQPIGPAPDPETTELLTNLQRTLEKYNAFDMMNELKTMFEEQAKQELFERVKAFHACKQEDGQSISSHLLNMKSYLDTLERLGYNYNMHSMRETLAELHAMLKLHEKSIPKKVETLAVLAIREGKFQNDKKKLQGAKGKDKGKTKLAYAPKPKIPPPPKRDNPTKDSICHHYKEGLRESRKLKHRALSLYMGNGMRAAVKDIGSFDLILPSGLIIVLDNCHFAPTVTRGVVLISRLVNNGYIHTFTNYGISVSKDNVFYFNAITRDGIYEIDMHNLYSNVSSMFNISNKRAKHAFDSSYLWHCRLGHINKKRMDKLQRDGILQPTHDESLEKCKSCISGKMASKPFPHQVKRSKDLLGLIHIDVCGPFRTVSREGASYFITFTDDFSRYGYVYLMKHTHEVFKTFKVFQNEDENQLGKKIKAIRSDRGGEYSSHKFVNHMKSCGIVYQLTPPYTPQHNGLSKRRNLTLLDMVRSMMNLTTLPKSFWGYALESVARILNMVPTKKVERTPYEIWHGKASKFARIPQAPDTYGFYVDDEEHELGDLNESPNYKVALSDLEFDKWLEAMNTEMQTMKDNQVWILVNLPPNGRTVGSKWIFKKNTDMDGKVKSWLCKCFSMKDLGEAAYILGIKIIRDRSTRLIALSQSDYLGWKTPRMVPYASAIGSIMYAVRCTRPDVAFAQNLCSRFQQNPSEIHWTAVKSILKYLRNTKDMVLVYGAKPEAELKVSCYADASFQTDKDDTKSQIGYVFILNGRVVDCKSAKQSTTAMSSIEAKYICCC